MTGPALFALEGHAVHLLPMTTAHVDGLLKAATADRSSFRFTEVPADRRAMAEYVSRAIARRDAGEHVPFVSVNVESGQIVGTTRFYDLTTWEWPAVTPGPGSGSGSGRARSGATGPRTSY